MRTHELETTAAPAPWINQYGQAVHHNPWGEYRPNPAYAAWAQEHAVAPAPSGVATRTRRALPHRRLQILAILIVVVVVLMGAKAAFGFWTVGGSGVGSAQSGTATVTVAASTGTPTTPLFPGGTGDVTLKINNPNAFAMKLTAVTGAGAITADGAHPTCSPTGVTFTDQSGLSTNLPAATNNIAINLPGAASMSTASANGCQGATFTIPVTISVQQP
jgi:hypothetical protein